MVAVLEEGEAVVAFDTELAERVRAVLAGSAPVPPVEKRMFGGLTFMVSGNMCCGIMGDDLLVRVGAAEVGRGLAEPGTRPFDMGRGPSADFLLVTAARVASDEALANWVRKALAFVAMLPAK
jgi:TfoX/Sxy family transcriptional regulator of competence genes